MKAKSRQFGVTLTEMAVVIAAVAILVVLGIPAARVLLKSFATEGSTRAMISAALSSARATAAQQQHYAGVRFQHAYDPKGPLGAPQYMIFIVHDSEILANGFRAVEGINPIRLPGSVGAMEVPQGNNDNEKDNAMIDDANVMNKSAFSVIFSPSGKLVIHEVRVSNNNSKDDIFNSESKAKDGIAMFVQDDDNVDGLKEETSRNCFIIYDRTVFDKVTEDRRWSDYLKNLEVIYINPYTGTMINR